jgi:hypothetical protein
VKTQVPFPSFDRTHPRAMDSGFIREGFLGEALSFAQFSNPLAKRY